MFFNSSSATPASSSNNNNNSDQPNPNNLRSIFSLPLDPPNNFFANPPPQPSGSLLGNPIQQQPQVGGVFSNHVRLQPPTGGFFSGQVQQQAQGGGLLGNSSQQLGGVLGHPPVSGMGGGFDPNKIHTFAPRTSIPLNGTVDYIGRNNPQNLIKTKEGHFICSMTARIKGYTLDEQRRADYFNLKNNTLNTDDKIKIICVINTNLRAQDIPVPGIHAQFPKGLLPSLLGIFADPRLHRILPPTTTLGALTSESLLINPQSSQNTNQPSTVQSSSLIEKTPKAFNKPVVEQPQTVIQTAKSNPGSFNYEFNKMLFVSGLVQLMEKHNMTVPENLLDSTDFAPQLLEFLEQHNISLPTENIPQFKIDSACFQTQSADECE